MDSKISKFTLEGLSCSSCALLIENLLKEHYDSHVQINFATRTLIIGSDDLEGINKVISRIEPGTKALPKSSITKNIKVSRSDWSYLGRLFLSFFLLILGSVLINNPSLEIWVPIGQILLLIA